MQEKYDEDGNREIKVSILGKHGSGKTSIVNRFVRGDFNESEFPTQRINIEKKVTKVNGNRVSFAFWDIAGQQGYNSIASLYFGKAHVVVFVYDISNYDSFVIAKEWVQRVTIANQCVFALVGNKVDDEENRQVPTAEAKEFANQSNAAFYECSARNNLSVDLIFIDACEKFLALPTRSGGIDIANNRARVPDDDSCAC